MPPGKTAAILLIPDGAEDRRDAQAERLMSQPSGAQALS